MTMKSPSTMHLLPTGGWSRCRCWSIHLRKSIGGASMSAILRQCGDALQLDRDRRRQHGDAERGAARLCGREEFGVDPIVDWEVAREVGEEHGDVDQILEA